MVVAGRRCAAVSSRRIAASSVEPIFPISALPRSFRCLVADRSGRTAAEDQSSLNLALFGSGWIADFHARGVLEHPRGELVAAANWRPESLAALAERHGIPRVTTDWRGGPAAPPLPRGIVAPPQPLHAP